MTIPKKIRPEFSDADVAHAYVDEFLNVSIATQLKVLREQREMTQEELARASGMKQERISVLESVNYSSWSINTLRKLAKALDVRLKVSFETFGSYFSDFERFSREGLQRLSRAEEIELDNKIDSARLEFRYFDLAEKSDGQIPVQPETLVQPLSVEPKTKAQPQFDVTRQDQISQVAH